MRIRLGPKRTRIRPAPHSLLLLLVTLGASGCGSTSPLEPPPGEPEVRGVILSIQITPLPGRVDVDRDPAGGFPCGIVAELDRRTRVLLPRGGGGWIEGSLGDLAPGDRVEVYPRGPVADSCPYQGTAGIIVRLARGGG